MASEAEKTLQVGSKKKKGRAGLFLNYPALLKKRLNIIYVHVRGWCALEYR